MPPLLALALTLLLIAYLFRKESGLPYKPSTALWIPTIWVMIIGSRSVTEWVNLGAPISNTGSIEEGSPLDRTVFFSLMIAGLVVLLRRPISWSWVFRNNIWLLLFFVYCGISILWSDFPFVAFKRWIKALGDPIMVMIVLSDLQPVRAVETLIKRCAYSLIPISILFMKYYPAYGRTYSEWTGAATYTGVTTNKNFLGYLLFICGLFFLFTVFGKGGKGVRGHLTASWMDAVIPVLFLFMIAWLSELADAKTALVCLGISSGIAVGLGIANLRKYLGLYLFMGLVAFLVLHLSLDITESLVGGLGRDSTLTGRTDLWPIVLNMGTNPMIGQGFESFWLGERLATLAATYYYKPNQAHNGYIEIYLNLGWIGLLVFAGVIVSCYRTMRKTLMLSFDKGRTELADFARLGTGYLIAYLIFNVTDASFKPLNLLFVIFLIFAIKYPQPHTGIPELY